MEIGDVRPPGDDPRDPGKRDIDPISFALERAATMLLWADEHLASFLKDRSLDSEKAERELGHLRNVIEQGAMHLGRIGEFILSGYSIDPNGPLKGRFAQLDRLRLIWDHDSDQASDTPKLGGPK